MVVSGIIPLPNVYVLQIPLNLENVKNIFCNTEIPTQNDWILIRFVHPFDPGTRIFIL